MSCEDLIAHFIWLNIEGLLLSSGKTVYKWVGRGREGKRKKEDSFDWCIIKLLHKNNNNRAQKTICFTVNMPLNFLNFIFSCVLQEGTWAGSPGIFCHLVLHFLFWLEDWKCSPLNRDGSLSEIVWMIVPASWRYCGFYSRSLQWGEL